MQMNSGIILAGQQPDFVNVLARSTQAAGMADATRQQQKEFQHANALRQFNQSQGAQVLAGDQNALNAYAGVAGPEAALGVKHAIAGQGRADTQLGIDQRNAGMREQEFDMRVKEYAAGLSAQERAAEAERIKTGVFSASAATSPEQWDQIVTQMGQPDLAGQFANKDALLRQYMTAAQILDADKVPEDPATIQALRIRAQEAGLQPGTPEYANFMAKGGKADDGLRITQGPDGLVIEQGSAVGGPNLGKPTEGQLAGAGYLQRMTGSEEIIRGLEGQGINAIPLMKSMALDTKAEGYVLSPQEASLAQAQRDWVRAKLRKESGAVIADEEMASEIKTYFPLPGEGPEIIAQKRAARARAERQMQIGSGAAAGMAGELSSTGDSLDAKGFEFSSDEEKSVFEKYSQP